MNDVEKEIIFRKTKELRQEIIDFERELIKIPSPNPPGEYQEISRCVADKLRTIGFEVDIVGDKPNKLNVIGRAKGTVGNLVLIDNAHLDTVPAGGGWTVDPYEAVMKDGKIFGRGAYDAKARIAVYVMAAKVIKEAGFRLKGDLIDCFTVDEESDGTDGAGYCTREGYIKGDFAILEGPHDEIWFAESGHITLRINVFGEAAHAMYPWMGINAINNMTDVLMELREIQRELNERKSNIPGLNYSTVNVGTIKGGDKSNMLPDRCSIDVDLRIVPEVDVDEVISRVNERIDKLKKKDPKFRAEVEVLMKVQASVTPPKDLAAIEIIKRVSREMMGFEPKVVGLNATSDGKYFRDQGIPTIHWGVGTSKNRAHGSDEFIEIEDLINLTSAHALVNIEFLDYEKGI